MRQLLIVGLIGLATAAGAGNGMGKAKDALAKQFKGSVLRLRVDVLQWTPGDGRIATTATTTSIEYPNVGQPLQFPAFAMVEVEAFYEWKEGVRIAIKSPGYKPRIFSSSLASTLAGSETQQAMQSASKDAEMRAQMGTVNLRVDSPAEVRVALARLFYIDGAQPTDDELARCLAAGRQGESPELSASRCGVDVGRLSPAAGK